MRKQLTMLQNIDKQIKNSTY